MATTGTQRFLAAFARWSAPALTVEQSLELAARFLARQGEPWGEDGRHATDPTTQQESGPDD